MWGSGRVCSLGARVWGDCRLTVTAEEGKEGAPPEEEEAAAAAVGCRGVFAPLYNCDDQYCDLLAIKGRLPCLACYLAENSKQAGKMRCLCTTPQCL